MDYTSLIEVVFINKNFSVFLSSKKPNGLNCQPNISMNRDFTVEIYSETLIMIEDLCLKIANKVLNQLIIPSPNRSAALFDVQLHRE